MSLLTITDLTLRIAGRPLLEEASLTIDAGQHVGLIGRNGAGKSTLLSAIYGDITPDSGIITRAQRTSMGRVKQETPSGENSLLETVLESHQERATLLHQSETLTDPIALSDIHERLIAIDAHTAPARASAILSGLGFDYDAQQRPVSDFSGGWRMRVALASALFLAPDLLLLDEPTNHLDIEATLWLESWLKKFSGTVLMVSHDRALLDHCVDHIAHLDKGKLSLTPGGYDRFIQIKTEQALQQNRAAQKISEQRAKMEDFVRRFRAKATKARQAQARLKALARLPQIDCVIEEAGTEFSFPSPSSLPPPMLNLEDVSTGYGEKIILKSLSLRLDIDDRIALLGRNGHGKSTFAKLLSGEISPMKGHIHASHKLRIGYFAQHQNDALITSDTPIAHMSRALPNASPTEIRAQLARFGLTTERAETKINALSGGEKARLLLSLATRHAPHLLILDEPTNHLDLDARDALIRALCNFEGAIILISHDSHLVESVADTLWIADNQTITPFEGDMNDYKIWLDQRAKDAQKELNKHKIASQSPHQQEKEDDPSNKGLPHAQKKEILKEQTRKLAPLRRKIRDLEATMEKLTIKKHKIEEKLADPELYQSGKAEDITLLNTKRASLEKELEEIEILWLDSQDSLETQMLL